MPKKEERFTKRRLFGSRITTIVSISLVLFAIGLIGLLLLHTKKLSDYVKENIGFSVYMNKNVKEAEIIHLQKELDANEYVRSTEYISEEKAAETFQEELGEDFVKFIGYNPLHTSIEVHLKAQYAYPVYFEEIEQQLKKNPNVKEIVYQKSLVQQINSNISKISAVLLVFSILLLVIAITLINNTIRLAVYSKRFLIKSMQLVGATEGFIRRPFLNTSLIHGMISSLLAIFMLTGVIYVSRKEIPEIISLQSIDLFLLLFAFVVLVGLTISWISTFISVRKYLKIKTDYLYF
ncbi:MAG: permease-like cell division protein FtsX [Bacteroidales bacterium]|jgi:cell division transport system permease protein|nr:permease-like cell division protein FtsX [Bacteroidales bacterium]MDD4213268.1 permease-like cell division protein FtsX [Bacteroidales bacterium]